jgi:hypothetical protein
MMARGASVPLARAGLMDFQIIPPGLLLGP